MSSYLWWLLGYEEESSEVIQEILADEKVKSARHETLKEIKRLRKDKIVNKPISVIGFISDTIKNSNTSPTPTPTTPTNSPEIKRRIVRRPVGLKIVPPMSLIERVKYNDMKRKSFIEALDECSNPYI